MGKAAKKAKRDRERRKFVNAYRSANKTRRKLLEDGGVEGMMLPPPSIINILKKNLSPERRVAHHVNEKAWIESMNELDKQQSKSVQPAPKFVSDGSLSTEEILKLSKQRRGKYLELVAQNKKLKGCLKAKHMSNLSTQQRLTRTAFLQQHLTAEQQLLVGQLAHSFSRFAPRDREIAHVWAIKAEDVVQYKSTYAQQQQQIADSNNSGGDPTDFALDEDDGDGDTRSTDTRSTLARGSDNNATGLLLDNDSVDHNGDTLNTAENRKEDDDSAALSLGDDSNAADLALVSSNSATQAAANRNNNNSDNGGGGGEMENRPSSLENAADNELDAMALAFEEGDDEGDDILQERRNNPLQDFSGAYVNWPDGGGSIFEPNWTFGEQNDAENIGRHSVGLPRNNPPPAAPVAAGLSNRNASNTPHGGRNFPNMTVHMR